MAGCHAVGPGQEASRVVSLLRSRGCGEAQQFTDDGTEASQGHMAGAIRRQDSNPGPGKPKVRAFQDTPVSLCWGPGLWRQRQQGTEEPGVGRGNRGSRFCDAQAAVLILGVGGPFTHRLFSSHPLGGPVLGASHFSWTLGWGQLWEGLRSQKYFHHDAKILFDLIKVLFAFSFKKLY